MLGGTEAEASRGYQLDPSSICKDFALNSLMAPDF